MSTGYGTLMARTFLSELGTAASLVSMLAVTLLLLAALAGIISATLRFVSERSYRSLWEIQSISSEEPGR